VHGEKTYTPLNRWEKILYLAPKSSGKKLYPHKREVGFLLIIKSQKQLICILCPFISDLNTFLTSMIPYVPCYFEMNYFLFVLIPFSGRLFCMHACTQNQKWYGLGAWGTIKIIMYQIKPPPTPQKPAAIQTGYIQGLTTGTLNPNYVCVCALPGGDHHNPPAFLNFKIIIIVILKF